MNHVSHKRGRSFVFLFQSQNVIWYLIRTMSLNCLQVNWMMNRLANVDVEFVNQDIYSHSSKKCPDPLICIENSYAKMAWFQVFSTEMYGRRRCTFRVNFYFAVLPRAKLFPGGVKKICGARKGNFVHWNMKRNQLLGVANTVIIPFKQLFSLSSIHMSVRPSVLVQSLLKHVHDTHLNWMVMLKR